MIGFLHPLAQLPVTQQWLIVAGCAVLAAGALLYFLHCQQRLRRMTDTPTSRIRSAAQGFAEFEGIGRMLDGEPVLAPLTGLRCLWWEYRVDEKQQNSSGRGSTWVTVQQDRSDAIFALVDATGRCIVDPDHAQVITGKADTWYGDSAWPQSGPGAGKWALFAKYRYHQRVLPSGTPLFAQGLFRTQSGAGRFDEADELAALLAEWKSDQAGLLKHFDVNRDGKVDLREWEAARRVALMRVRRELLEQDSQPGLHVLTRPTDGRALLLSAISQASLVRRYRWCSLACVLVFLPASVIGAELLLRLAS